MTDENPIRKIEQILAALRAGDNSAIERLTAILGDGVGGDKIVGGDVAKSQAVTIGRNARAVVHQCNLPPELST